MIDRLIDSPYNRKETLAKVDKYIIYNKTLVALFKFFFKNTSELTTRLITQRKDSDIKGYPMIFMGAVRNQYVFSEKTPSELLDNLDLSLSVAYLIDLNIYESSRDFPPSLAKDSLVLSKYQKDPNLEDLLSKHQQLYKVMLYKALLLDAGDLAKRVAKQLSSFKKTINPFKWLVIIWFLFKSICVILMLAVRVRIMQLKKETPEHLYSEIE